MDSSECAKTFSRAVSAAAPASIDVDVAAKTARDADKQAPPSQGLPWLTIVAAVVIVGGGVSALVSRKNWLGPRAFIQAPPLLPPPSYAALKSSSSKNVSIQFPVSHQSSATGVSSPLLPRPLAASKSPFTPEAMKECLQVIAPNLPLSSTSTRTPAMTLDRKFSRRLTFKYEKTPVFCGFLFASFIPSVTSNVFKQFSIGKGLIHHNYTTIKNQTVGFIWMGVNSVITHFQSPEEIFVGERWETEWKEVDCPKSPVQNFPCIAHGPMFGVPAGPMTSVEPEQYSTYIAQNRCALYTYHPDFTQVIQVFCDSYLEIIKAIHDSMSWSNLKENYACTEEDRDPASAHRHLIKSVAITAGLVTLSIFAIVIAVMAFRRGKVDSKV
eukprot:GHVT01037123.1.p1 GENE.GHVT01037123.1~~GHVT01037123.1.p1  ORF type:complete len:383 (-),score=47.01 GHVT01037123.1:252-1400(-)